MLPKRSNWSSVLLSSAVLGTSILACGGWAAQAVRGAETEAVAEAKPSEAAVKLQKLADNFLHYSVVGDIAEAKNWGQAILNANAAPKDFLAAFEAAGNDRDVTGILERNQRQPELKDVSRELLKKYEEGQRASARDPVRIKREIERLGDSPRAYLNAKSRLLAAGEYAVEFYIGSLRDTKQKGLYPYLLKLIGEGGQAMLPPLLQQLSTSDVGEKITLVNVIGQIGYPQAVPYLKAIVADGQSTPELKSAAQSALSRCDVRGQYGKMSAGDAFYALAQQYFSHASSASPQHPKEEENPIWFYDKGLDNVVGVPVPTSIWSSVQTMRACEQALKLEPTKGQAISLWLAANMRRELQLPGDKKDLTRAEGTPDAAYYAVAAGPVYLNPVLQLALTEHDSALILRTISALEKTGGTQGLVSSQDGGTPLVKALGYPDRSVRFAAAFALARANPAKDFAGSFRVVPILAEALGTPNVLLVNADQDARNRMKGLLSAGYNVFDGPTLSAALENTGKATGFDVVVVPAGAEVAHVQEAGRTDYRLLGAPVLVLGAKEALPAIKAQLGEVKGFAVLDAEADDKAVGEAVASAKAELGSLPMDKAQATEQASMALKLLAMLAVDHASIYKVTDAVPTLIEVLKDKNLEIVTATAGVLGQLNNADAQKALAQSALAEGGDTAVRTTLFVSLAESAKRGGNLLEAGTVDRLIKVVGTADLDPKVRNAAAAALGALNVPSNQACTLILNQAK